MSLRETERKVRYRPGEIWPVQLPKNDCKNTSPYLMYQVYTVYIYIYIYYGGRAKSVNTASILDTLNSFV